MRLPLASPLTLSWALALSLLNGCGLGPLEVVDTPSPSVGLVAYWSFDEAQGTSVLDRSGNGLDGQLTGGSWISGRFGGALYLSRGDAVAVPNFPDATQDWTVSAWVRYGQADIGTDLATIVGTEIPSTGGWEMQGPVNASTSKLEFSYARSGHYSTLICCEIQPDEWMHFTAVVDGRALTMTLYLDGIRQISESVASRILPGNPTLHIGIEEKPDGQFVGPFQGAVDEIRIYGRALNPAEVLRLYAGP